MILNYYLLFLFLFLLFRYRFSQVADTTQSSPCPTGLPPYCLALRRMVDPGSSSDAHLSTGVHVVAADLPHAHRGSQTPVPVRLTGEFMHHTAGVLPQNVPGDHHHRFNLQWGYQTEGEAAYYFCSPSFLQFVWISWVLVHTFLDLEVISCLFFSLL